jgi:hypothetical protein
MCRNQGSARVELIRDNVDLFCMMGHRMPHAAMLNMNPEMIKTEVRFKPDAHDVKAEVWVNAERLARAKEALGERFHPTIASLISCCMAGEPVIIDGQQAAELRKLGIRNGQEMLAAAKQNLELAGQNENLTMEVNRWEKRIQEAMAGVH